MKYLLLLLFPFGDSLKTPSIEWQKSVGGSGKDYANLSDKLPMVVISLPAIRILPMAMLSGIMVAMMYGW